MTGSNSPLYVAAQHGHEEAVRALIELGVDAGAVDEHGLTALHFAEQHGHEKAMSDYTFLGGYAYSAVAPFDKADPTDNAVYGLRKCVGNLKFFENHSPLFSASLNGQHETIGSELCSNWVVST